MEEANEYMPNNIKRGDLLGEGSFGEVYSGILKSNGKKIAIKRLNKGKLAKCKNGYLLQAFQFEIECMKKCNCENSVFFYNNFETTTNYNIIMELCDNDLEHELRKRPEGFNVEEIRNIFSQLNNVFKKMVANDIIHRDLKLGNILVKYTNEEKTKFIPKLSDYGFSKVLTEKSTGTYLGTPITMAPEIIDGRSYGKEADLWSVGILLYQLHFNEHPYNGNCIDEIRKKIKNKVPYKQTEDYFLRDLINKCLVENPLNRITWDQYFEHPFFMPEEQRKEILNKIINGETKKNEVINNPRFKGKDTEYIYVKEFDTGIKNDLYKCIIAKDINKPDKFVFIKIYKEEFVNSHYILFRNEFHLHRTFSKNNNALQLIHINKEKDVYLIFNYIDCEILTNYLAHHDFDEKDFHLFSKELFENIFNYSQIFYKPFIFLSLFSFAITKEGKPIIFDYGIHKFFLSAEEVMDYYFSNKAEIAESSDQIKTNIMNYGIILLKIFYGKNLKLDIEGNEMILPSNKTLSNNFKKFLSKCLKKNILKRSNWIELINEKFMKNGEEIDEEGKKTLISDKKLKGILRALDKKYELINKYYETKEIDENTPYRNEMEKFLILTLFEQLILSKILNPTENEKYKDMTKEITFIDIKGNKAEELRINFDSSILKNMKIFSNNKDNESIKEFIPKLKEHINKLKEILKKLHKITKSIYFEGNYKDFLNEFNNLIKEGIENLRNYFIELTNEANNNWLKKDYKSAELKAPIAEYISEIVLFLIMSIKDIENEKIYFNKKELLKKFTEVFEKENEENVEVSCIKFAKKKDKYILVSFLRLLFIYLINSCDIKQINIKKNTSSLDSHLKFYQKLMKTLLDIK